MNTYNEKDLEKAILMLKARPYKVTSLSKKFKKSERTIKRWLVELGDRGYRVVRNGVEVDSPYVILDRTDLVL